MSRRGSAFEQPLVLLSLSRVLLFLGVMALVTGWELQRRNLMVFGCGTIALLAVGYARKPRLHRIRLRRDHLEHIFEGESLRVGLELHAQQGAGRPLLVEVRDRFPAGERTSVRALIPDPFARGTGIVLRHRPMVTQRRGLYVLGPVELSASDPLGLAAANIRIPLFSELLVYPSAAILSDYQPFHTYTHRHQGEWPIPLPGWSQEFLHVREYRHGDSPRLVHWPTSARQGSLFVKALEDNTMAEILLVLDMLQLSHTGLGNVTSQETLVAAAASLVTHAIESSHRAGILMVRDPPVLLPVDGGSGHLTRLLNGLALATSSGHAHFAVQAGKNWPRLPHGSTIVPVVAATTVVESDFDPWVGELLAAGHHVAVVLIDDRTWTLLYMDQQMRAAKHPPTLDIAARLAGLGAQVTVLAKGDKVRERLELA